MRFWASFLIGALMLSFVGCASLTPPPSLTGNGRVAFYANEITIAFGTLQHAAIELNKVSLVSDANTKIIVDATADVVTTLKATPDSWQATASAGLDRVEMRLDAAGKSQLDPYLHGVQTVLKELR